jgi:hypothetical protein
MAQSGGNRRDEISVTAGMEVPINIATVAASKRRKKIARGFNRGLSAKMEQAPQGRQKTHRKKRVFLSSLRDSIRFDD